MLRLSELLPRFGIKHVLLLTSLAAFLTASYLVVGPRIAFCCLCVAHGLAPTLCILCFALARNQFLAARLVAAFGVLAALTVAMLFITYLNYGKTAIPWMLVAMLVEWPGQFLVGATLYSVQSQPSK